jgi:hypothetical protein
VHNLSASFVLGYHGCDRETGEKLLQNERFRPSENSYDWLGSGIYFWEANPDRALDWAKHLAARKKSDKDIEAEPFVVGAVIDLGFCLDLISANGSLAVEEAYVSLLGDFTDSGDQIPKNTGGQDLLHRKLDCMVINYLHKSREKSSREPFGTVRAMFTEGELLYPTSGFRRKTHIQICVRNQGNIKGVFRVPDHHFSQVAV